MARKRDKTKNAFPASFCPGLISHCWYFTLNSFVPDSSSSSFWVACGGWPRGLQSVCNTLYLPLHPPYISPPAPAWGPSWGLQSLMNCSFTWAAVLQQLLRCGPSPWSADHQKCAATAEIHHGLQLLSASASALGLHTLQLPSVYLHLLWPGALHGLQGGSSLSYGPTGAQLLQRKHNIKGTREEPLL